jgi:hypothetical protein
MCGHRAADRVAFNHTVALQFVQNLQSPFHTVVQQFTMAPVRGAIVVSSATRFLVIETKPAHAGESVKVSPT